MNNCLSDYIAVKTKEYLEATDNTSDLYDIVIKEVEKSLIETTFKHTKGNQTKTADILGITRNTLRKKMEEFGIGK